MNELDIHGYTHPVDILELKNWVDKQIEEGRTKVSLDISWGYYSDIDGLTLVAE